MGATDMMIRDSELTDHDRSRIWRAQLADMPLMAVIAYLRERGYEVSSRPFFRPDRLLAPLADDDLPFVAERDGL